MWQNRMMTSPFVTLTFVLQECICSQKPWQLIYSIIGEEPVFHSAVCCSITAETVCLPRKGIMWLKEDGSILFGRIGGGGECWTFAERNRVKHSVCFARWAGVARGTTPSSEVQRVCVCLCVSVCACAGAVAAAAEFRGWITRCAQLKVPFAPLKRRGVRCRSPERGSLRLFVTARGGRTPTCGPPPAPKGSLVHSFIVVHLALCHRQNAARECVSWLQ